MEIKYITVAAINRYIQYKFESDVNLQLVYLKAEISNVRLSKGILYFVLKDDEAEIEALMFQNYASRLNFAPQDGLTVLVSGKVSVYPKRGRYSFQVMTMEKAGLGEAYLEFLRLKDSLAKEGLFAVERKLALPKMSEAIGVITSPTGDALHDVVSTIQKRFPIAQIYLYPALVQGLDAPKSLIKALNKCISENLVDVIIICRGGGTVEDLSCFNDEALARTIFASPIPTVSGVGHEQDYTICDFVASYRAPTPTGAAVSITKDKSELFALLDSFAKQLKAAMRHQLINAFNDYQALISSYGLKNFPQILEARLIELNQLKQRLLTQSPLKLINDYDSQNYQLTERLQRSISLFMDYKNADIAQLIDKLIILNPLNLMKKGYAVTYQKGKLITSSKDLSREEHLRVLYHDGELEAKILNIKKNEE